MAQDPPAVNTVSSPTRMTDNENDMNHVVDGMMDKSNSASFAQIAPHIPTAETNSTNTSNGDNNNDTNNTYHTAPDTNPMHHDDDDNSNDDPTNNCSFDAMIQQATSSMLSPNPPGRKLSNNTNNNHSLSHKYHNHTMDSGPSPLELYSLDTTDDYYGKYGIADVTREDTQELLPPRNQSAANNATTKSPSLQLSPTQESTTSNNNNHSHNSSDDDNDKTMIIHRRTWWCLWGIVVLVLILTGIGCTAVALGLVQINTSHNSSSSTAATTTESNKNNNNNGYWSGDAMELEADAGTFHTNGGVTTSDADSTYIIGNVPTSLSPSLPPTLRPSLRPSTRAPSTAPSYAAPTQQPSDLPSDVPSNIPSDLPSDMPSDVPSDLPSSLPSMALPSDVPSMTPPSAAPTVSAAPTLDTKSLLVEFLLQDTTYSAISRQALLNPRTPQGRALLWMTTEDPITLEYFPAFGVTSAESVLDDIGAPAKRQILQRYSLVALDLSLHTPAPPQRQQQSRSSMPTNLLELETHHLLDLARANLDLANGIENNNNNNNTASDNNNNNNNNGWTIDSSRNNWTDDSPSIVDDDHWNDDEIWAYAIGDHAWSYPELHECEWVGVDCGNNNDIVESIVWARRNLTGTVAPELALLTDLRHLDLAENDISGSLDIFWTLRELRKLYLFDNQFEGRINREVSGMSNLRQLYLGHNRLTGSLPGSLFQNNLRKLRKYCILVFLALRLSPAHTLHFFSMQVI